MLEFEGVTKELGDFRLDADFSCPSDGIIALFGRSGAGKTTLVRALAGLITPSQGRIALDGVTLFDAAQGIDLSPERRRVGYVFQEGRLFPHMTVRQNLLYGYRRTPREARRFGLEEIAGLLALEALLRRRPHDLSGGEQQRVALGRALLANPRLLLMDEPLSALDQPRKEEILPFIQKLRDRYAIPIVYVTHAMPEIIRLADTMVLISAGRIAAAATLEEVTSRLDLRPLTGRYEAGSVIPAQVITPDQGDGLSELAFAGGHLLVPALDLPAGARLRLRIRARDVALALAPPAGLSITNVVAARIAAVGEEEGPLVDVRLDCAGAPLWARITRRSLKTLELAPGRPVYALIKSVAIDRYSSGLAPSAGRFLEGEEAE